MKPPVIIVSLIHIQGPLKGQIQELSQEAIGIGRHPSNDVRFPPDLTIVSRNHARIVREGNRFRLVDKSANGTFVNGKKVTEVVLKDGDVIEFAEGGPKVSFLSEMKEEGYETPYSSEPSALSEPPVAEIPGPSFETDQQTIPEEAQQEPLYSPTPFSQRETSFELPVQNIAAPLVIQYGPTIRSYKDLPVVIGRHPRCDFVLDRPGILDQHAQVFFAQNRYWLKDLTGQALLSVNHQSVTVQVPLAVNDTISLGPRGPVFRFVGEGRLAEDEEASSEMAGRSEAASGDGQEAPRYGSDSEEETGSKRGVFWKMKKKLF